MQLAASHQAAGNVGCLQLRALGRRMGGEIAGDRNKDVPALVGVAPDRELPDSRLQHLVGMKARVFPQHRMREGGDQRLRRMAKRQVPRREPRREINLPLTVERVEQGDTDRLHIGGQIVEPLAVVSRNAGRRHVEVARQIESHRAVQYAPNGRGILIRGRGPDPLEHRVERIGVREDMVRRLPVAVFVGVPKRATLIAAA